MAGNFANSFVSVTWTTGDVATEAKFDNMTTNDQAHDAFAAEGLRLNNAVQYQGKEAGGTARDLIQINSSDEVVVGKNNEADHTVINAGTSKMVKIKVLRQDDTTNSYQENTIILHGWGQIVGDGTAQIEETITFGITFSSTPDLVANFASAYTSGTPATDLNSFNNVSGVLHAGNQSHITTTTFQFNLYRASGTLASGNFHGYSWIAVGELN